MASPPTMGHRDGGMRVAGRSACGARRAAGGHAPIPLRFRGLDLAQVGVRLHTATRVGLVPVPVPVPVPATPSTVHTSRESTRRGPCAYNMRAGGLGCGGHAALSPPRWERSGRGWRTRCTWTPGPCARCQHQHQYSTSTSTGTRHAARGIARVSANTPIARSTMSRRGHVQGQPDSLRQPGLCSTHAQHALREDWP